MYGNNERRTFMTNISKLVAALKGKVFKLSGEKINQTERNAFKAQVLESLAVDLFSAGMTAVRTSDGIVLEIENDELGSIYLELDVKVKNTDFDLDEAVADYQSKVTAAADRIAQVAKRKAERLAKKSAK
jgi:hypothetical protein